MWLKKGVQNGSKMASICTAKQIGQTAFKLGRVVLQFVAERVQLPMQVQSKSVNEEVL